MLLYSTNPCISETCSENTARRDELCVCFVLLASFVQSICVFFLSSGFSLHKTARPSFEALLCASAVY